MTGMMLLEALHEAADRRARVRLLLDDNGTRAWTASWPRWTDIPTSKCGCTTRAAGWPKTLGYLTDFSRLNRRMHNKPFTADNQATIIGGRNVGDDSALPTACRSPTWTCWRSARRCRTSVDFDRYWASDSALSGGAPARGRGGRAGPAQAARRRHERLVRRRRLRRGPCAPCPSSVSCSRASWNWNGRPRAWSATIRARPQALRQRPCCCRISCTRSSANPPSRWTWCRLFRARRIRHARLQRHGLRGVRVRVLTNSLEATDVAACTRLRQAPRRSAGGRVELFE